MQCAICLNTPNQPITMSCCKNNFCSECIGQWVQIRSVCPLCCRQTGLQKVNNLIKKISNESFDDGSLMIEAEIREIKQRIKFIEQRVANKRQQFNSLKSGLSSSLMNYFTKKLQEIYDFERVMEQQVQRSHRASAFEYMQLIVETMIDLQTSLDTNMLNEDQQFDQGDQLQEEQGSEYSEEEYQQYQLDVQKKGNGKFNKHGKGQESKMKQVKQN